jgi:outer membrane protein assembly factor BamB
LCLEADTGKKLWGYNASEKFGAEPPEFGLSASPVVIDNMLVLVVGGKNGKSLVALDKSTGEVHWTSLSDKAGYSTPIRIEVDGVPQIIVLMGEALVSVSPKDGREFWRRPWKTTLDANVATPIVHGNRLFVSTGYGTGCGTFELSAKEGKPAIKELWKNKNMKNYFSTSVLLDGFLYGFDNTVLVCMDFQTGKVTWRERGFNRGSLLAADGKLIVYGERATLALAEARSDKYTELSKAAVLSGKTWTVPTLADGRLFVRNEESLACFDLRPSERTAR